MNAITFKENTTIVEAKDRVNKVDRKYDVDDDIVTIYHTTELKDTTKVWLSTRIGLGNYLDAEGKPTPEGMFVMAGALLINPIRSEKTEGLKSQNFEHIDPNYVWRPEPNKVKTPKTPREKLLLALMAQGYDVTTATLMADNLKQLEELVKPPEPQTFATKAEVETEV